MAGKERESGTKQRLQFDFSEAAVAELERLKGKIGASSRAEVIRHALGVLKWIVDEQLQGHEIRAVHENKGEEIRTIIKPVFPFRTTNK
jgi:hypothetical protein